MPLNYPTHSYHTFHSTLSPLFGRLTHFPSFLFFILSHTLLSTLISSLTGTSTPPPPPLPPSFSNKITGKFLRTHKHCHILSKVKISNLFAGFYTFTWGYFYLSFNNDTHVIYVHWKWYLCVFMYGFCIGGIIWWVGIWFVLMMTTYGLFMVENLGVLSYNMWWFVNLIFPLPLGLFRVSWSSKFLVLEDILILLSWVS